MNCRKRKKITLYAVALLCNLCTNGLSASAQAPATGRNYIPPSPNAASLGMFTDQTKASYSGLADITIPLYEINTGSVKLPLSLNYFTGGIKAKDEASWVGLNWALNAGGVVARIKRDKDDFGFKGFYKAAPDERLCAMKFKYDKEPDIFYYNFNGYTGKFLIDYNPAAPGYLIRHLAKSPLKVFITPELNWQIITPDGVIYQFSKQEKTEEHFRGGDGSEEYETFISGWFLTSITAPNGEQISFVYNWAPEKVRKNYAQYSSHTFLTAFPNFNNCTDYNIAIIKARLESGTRESVSVTAVEEVLLKKIIFTNGVVVFNTTPRDDLNTLANPGSKLSSVVIYKGNEDAANLLTTFNFTYDYYTSGSGKPGKISKRLRLLKVWETAGGERKGAYDFLYNGSYVTDKDISINYDLGYISQSQNSMLKSIRFPTGGYTDYTFENNRLTDIDGITQNGTGLRVKEISQNDGISSNINRKQFVYEGGRLLGRHATGYVQEYNDRQDFADCPFPGHNYCNFSWRDAASSDASSLAEIASGQVYGYDKVSVLLGSNGQYGKTEYVYENSLPAVLPPYPGMSGFYIPLNITQKTGLLKTETDFKFVNGNFIPVRKKELTYTPAETYPVIASRRSGNNCYDYTLTTEWVQQTRQTEYSFTADGMAAMTLTKSLGYANPYNLLPTTIDETNSKGETVTTSSRYPHDMLQQGTATVYNLMIQKNIINPLVEQYVTNNGNTISQTKTVYRNWDATGRIIAPESITKIKGNSYAGIPTPANESRFYRYDDRGNPLEVGSGANIHTSYIWAYNKTMPIAEAVNAAYTDIGYTGFEDPAETFWHSGGYDASLLVAGGKTGKYACICPAGTLSFGPTHDFLPTAGGQYVFSCWIKTAPGFTGTAAVVLHTSDPGRKGIVFPANNTESYKRQVITSTNGQWRYVEVMLDMDKLYQQWGNRVPLNLRAYVYNTDTGNDFMVDDMQFRPAVAKMTTYTCEPLVGITSVTSANNKTTCYQYDALNRLTLVRDNEKNIIKQISYHYRVPPGNEAAWETTGNKRCTLNADGTFTGMQETEEQDINPNSITYRQTRWAGSSASADCPVVIYAQLERRNITYEASGGSDYTYGDVYLKLVNAAGQPVTLSNFKVNMRSEEKTCDNQYGCNTTNQDFSVTINGSEALVSSGLLQRYQMVNGNTISSYDLSHLILPGVGYTPR